MARDRDDGRHEGEDRDVTRHVARYRVDRLRERDAAPGSSEPTPGAVDEQAEVAGAPVVRGRMQHRAQWVDRVVADAVARGEFDDLPLSGKPIPGIDRPHDPDWWLKALVEREHLTGLAPEALRLRTEAAALEERLDEERHEARVREVVEELNARIVAARRQLLGGPPVVTPLRDVDQEVRRWRERREERSRRAADEGASATTARPATAPRRVRWRRRRG